MYFFYSFKTNLFTSADGQPFTTGGKNFTENITIPGSAWWSEMTEASKQQSPAADSFVGDAVRNHLFGNQDSPDEDLISRNIQRGRDHGIPSYGVLREACGLAKLTGQPAEIEDRKWEGLMVVYRNKPSNIDPYTGGLAERPPLDGLVGPLFSCIIKKQFLALRDGDRYFFTHPPRHKSTSRGLLPKAKTNILGRTLSAVMCDNINATLGVHIQKSVFKLPDIGDNAVKECLSKKLDFGVIAKEILKFDPIKG